MAEICVNCKHDITENFCPHCAQPARVGRISFKENFLDFFNKMYGFDGMFSRTIRDVSIRPGTVAKKYIEGNRVLYFGPVGYFFAMITLCLFIFSLIGVDFLEYMKSAQDSMPIQQDKSQMTDIAFRWISENVKFFVFLMIPCQAFTARYLFFRKNGYSFMENMVLPLYVTGHLYWWTSITAFIYKYNHSHSIGSSFLITLGFMGFAYANMMTYQSKLKAFIKGVFTYASGYFLFILAFAIITLIVVLALVFISPETFEMIRPKNNNIPSAADVNIPGLSSL